MPRTYTIVVEGRLDPRWSEVLAGLRVTHDGPLSVLRGPLRDQAELHGVLRRISDLGVPLVSLQAASPDLQGPTDPT